MDTLSVKKIRFLESVRQNILAENLGELEERRDSTIFKEFLTMMIVWGYDQVGQEDFTQLKTLVLSRLNIKTFHVFWSGWVSGQLLGEGKHPYLKEDEFHDN